MKTTRSRICGALAAGLSICGALAAGLSGPAAARDDSFKIGVVTFLSGQAAESFGVPAWRGSKLLIGMLNEGGKLPPPYDRKGFGGMSIEPVFVDEAGGATKQVQEFRNLVQREKVDAVVGYVSSGDCLAIAPVADELKAFTILYDCGTPRVFEDGSYRYVFRTAAHATTDNVSLARYLKSRNFEVRSFAGLNQDYAWGQDSWADFKGAMKQLYPGAEVKTALFPKFGAGQYGTEISALLRERPALVHSSLWGGDLQGFLIQSTARGLHKRAQLVLTTGEHVIPQLQNKMPDGIFLGARGVNGLAARARGGRLKELTDTVWEAYEAEYQDIPTQSPFRMWQAIFGLKTAIEKAMAENGGRKPDSEELAAAMKGLTWDAPSGRIEMALADGHQAIQPNAYGTSRWNAETGMMELVDVEIYAARCVNPPNGMKSREWIAKGFPGAQCE